MFSRSMYCQTSSSVQLEIGNARKCSPGCMRVLNSVHSSGRCSLGCHWPKLSRCEKMRSLARAFSSSRRAPPISASKRNSSIASSSVTDWCTLRDSPRMRQAHGAALHRVLEMAARSARSPSSATRRVAELGHLGKVVAGVDISSGYGRRPRTAVGAALLKAFSAHLQQHQRILAAREQQGRALEGGRHFAQDEDRFLLEPVEVAVVSSGSSWGSTRAFMRDSDRRHVLVACSLS